MPKRYATHDDATIAMQHEVSTIDAFTAAVGNDIMLDEAIVITSTLLGRNLSAMAQWSMLCHHVGGETPKLYRR